MLTALPMVVIVGRGQTQVEVSLDTPLLASRFFGDLRQLLVATGCGA